MRKVPTWDEYFMIIAEAVKLRSKDLSTQVGSVIVDKNKHIIGTGYNGFATGVEETEERWQRPAKYFRVIHSENNAIVNATCSTIGATLYTTLYPCERCAKLIVSAGIKKVFYKNTTSDSTFFPENAALLLAEAGVEVIQLT